MKISVVIPTAGRPVLLQRAIRSVLQQTFGEFELIVVVDGSDPETLAVLPSIGDPRLRWLPLPIRSGGARARQAGISEAKGEWIAFLDDDDEWLREKLDHQLKAAEKSEKRFPIVSTRIRVQGRDGNLYWPRRVVAPGEPMSEYLFCRSGLFSGDGQIVTSAVFAKRALLELCPFNPEVRKHDDTEWYLTADNRDDTEFIIVPEVLTVWHSEGQGTRVSQSEDWTTSFRWAQRCRPLMTKKAYASFLLTAVAAEAAQVGSFRALRKVVSEAFRHGRPKLLDLGLALGFWLFPLRLRHRIRQWKERLASRKRPMRDTACQA